MRPEDRKTARKHLDNKLTTLNKINLDQPPRGWIRAIRESLGMTTVQLGKRLGVSQPRAVAIEKAEKNGVIKIETLRRAAEALDCHLVYTLVPNSSLENSVKRRAESLVKKRMDITRHSMSLEAQSVDPADEKIQLEKLIQKALNTVSSKIWDDE